MAGDFNISCKIYRAAHPILHVDWSLASGSIALDLAINENLPLEHARWFRNIGAMPALDAMEAEVSALVTVARCVKLWLRQRQIPKFKEGGLSTVTWVQLAVHSYFSTQAPREDGHSPSQPLVAILARLAAFFHHWAAPGSLNGTLRFQVNPLSSEFIHKPRTTDTCWDELAVMGPIPEVNPAKSILDKRLLPATQMLIKYELRRATGLLPLPQPRGCHPAGCERFRKVFEPVSENVNVLP
eukprot:UN5027